MVNLRKSDSRRSSDDFLQRKIKTRRRLDSDDDDDDDDHETPNEEISNFPTTSVFSDPIKPVNDSLRRLKLSKWCFKISPKQFSVTIEGFTAENLETGKYTRSSKIAERLSSSLLRSFSGTMYILDGHLDEVMSKIYCYPDWLIKKFRKGFPKDWQNVLKCYYEKAKADGEFKTSLLDRILIDTASELSEMPSSFLWSNLKLNFSMNTKIPANKLLRNGPELACSSKNCAETRQPDQKIVHSSSFMSDLTVSRNQRINQSIVSRAIRIDEVTENENINLHENEKIQPAVEEIPARRQFFSRRLSSKLKEFRARKTSTPLIKRPSRKRNVKEKIPKQKKIVNEHPSAYDFSSETTANARRTSFRIDEKRRISPRETKKNVEIQPKNVEIKSENVKKKSKNVNKKANFDSAESPKMQYKIQTTRFGRTIKPPLANWNGQRIVYDIYGEPLSIESGSSTPIRDRFTEPMMDLAPLALHLNISEENSSVVQTKTKKISERKNIKMKNDLKNDKLSTKNDPKTVKKGKICWSEEEINILKKAIDNNWPKGREWEKVVILLDNRRTKIACRTYAGKHFSHLKNANPSSSKKIEKQKILKQDKVEKSSKIRKRKMATLKEKKEQKKLLKLAAVGTADDADFFREHNLPGYNFKIIDLRPDNLSTATTPMSMVSAGRFSMNESQMSTPCNVSSTPCASDSILRSKATQYVHQVQRMQLTKVSLPQRRELQKGKVDVGKVVSMLKNVDVRKKLNIVDSDSDDDSSTVDDYFQFNSP